MENLWIVNKRTGLQYKHDFSSAAPFQEQFKSVKEKYMRRAKRLCDGIEKAKRPLFLFIARDEGLCDGLLFRQKEILKNKYPRKNITFLYILHDPYFSKKEYAIHWIDKDICKITCNVTYSQESYPESWNGNTGLYYKLLKRFVRKPKWINRVFSRYGKHTARHTFSQQQKNVIYKNPLFCLYKTSRGININLFGFIKTRIWKIKK